MVKLTAELIQNSMQYINPVKDRELDLRGYKIPEIENLGATGDQFDTIDFSENDIRKLDGFPYLKRLKCLLMNNNRIIRIGENLEDHIPNLETLILTGNHLEELSDIDALITLERLTTLSLLHNPITAKPHYRLYDYQNRKFAKYAEAISKASSLEEVERLQKLLQAGHIPGQDMLNGQDYYSKMEVENGH
ncbi:u2 small nuclear ribonucleoprotein a [Holotrichia oblita]|uniref:U2 small nuclear ribonucleoprotein a n=1 Tax=Holotrichia oblita TaxID=644536 RepID=A0ACB9T5P6_HOLOL|nr:u2 small nuclear ribonucleoprotein a [Holotrichia oblita]